MSVLVDTNILLRSIQPNHPFHLSAVKAVTRLLDENETVFFTLQNIAEFWNVATRPLDRNGLGLRMAEVLHEVEEIEQLLSFLPDSPAVYGEWKRLVSLNNVRGVRVHDAHLVASMKAHHVSRILTFDPDDFSGFSGIEVLDPKSLST